MSGIVGYPDRAHPAVRHAAQRLGQTLHTNVRKGNWSTSGFSYWVAEAGDIPGLKVPARHFRIVRVEGRMLFSGDRPRSVLAGVMYYLHHRARGHRLPLPIERSSPYPERLVIEDFPCNCYAPTGFDFDIHRYAENLAALGFTSMECNRYSCRQPLGLYHWNYAFTNPSLSDFIWTRWHKGVWNRKVVEANAAELDRMINIALEYDLAPLLTSFLPRPYPDKLFTRYPHFRGPIYHTEYMRLGGHPPEYCLNTDHPEVQAFYRQIYANLLDRYPCIGHLLFWHADLGTQFYGDGDGPRKLKLVERVAGFRRMIANLILTRRLKTQVWMNPWGMDIRKFDDLEALVPLSIGFVAKDNPGYETFAGTSPMKLGDATIINACTGPIQKRTFELAAKRGRPACIGQYQDFSEDLDPVIAVPHPLMTFRKFKTLQVIAPKFSALQWGAVSPDVAPVNVNQDVIREMTWGSPAGVFNELLEDLVPAGFSAGQCDDILWAWRKVDRALQVWPQLWGLRLQDNGLRLRWLVRPFGFHMERFSDKEKTFFLDHQIYRVDPPDPFHAFIEINAHQALEISTLYADMTDDVAMAERRLARLNAGAQPAMLRKWLAAQGNVLKTLRLFWVTYRNLLEFYGRKAVMSPAAKRRCLVIMQAELANVEDTRRHLRSHPETIVIAKRGKWGQCLGADVERDLSCKADLMKRDLDCIKKVII
jgi:hypothetical protein